jgi:hypothetical protein
MCAPLPISRFAPHIPDSFTFTAKATDNYTYVNGNPLSYSDPLGLTTWTGNFDLKALIIGVGAAYATFDLTSKECVNGKRVVATVKFAGPGGGVGPKFIIGSQDRGSIVLDDHSDTVDPSRLEGAAGVVGVGATIGNLSVGFTRIRLGHAFSKDVETSGLDVGASIMIGSSTVVSTKYVSCGCSSGSGR